MPTPTEWINIVEDLRVVLMRTPQLLNSDDTKAVRDVWGLKHTSIHKDAKGSRLKVRGLIWTRKAGAPFIKNLQATPRDRLFECHRIMFGNGSYKTRNVHNHDGDAESPAVQMPLF